MSEKFVEEVVKKIREHAKSFTWSDKVGLLSDDRILIIEIKKDNYNANMQENEACFEGWALALKTYFMDKNYDFVELRCNNILFEKGKLENGHANRFLYRALRFSEQYKDWFRLDASLQKKVDEFKQYLDENEENLLNNVPSSESDDGYKNDGIDMFAESFMEKFIYEHKDILSPFFRNKKLDNIIVNRQLPVGLFDGSVETSNKIFTGGRSAIDLWAYDSEKHNEFFIFELKFLQKKVGRKNKKIGIISEIFFYANYIYDLLTEKGCFKLNEDVKEYIRDYDKLIKCKQENKINIINAVMLVDKGNMHPAITRKLLETLNAKDRGVSINYLAAEYGVEIQLLDSMDVSK